MNKIMEDEKMLGWEQGARLRVFSTDVEGGGISSSICVIVGVNTFGVHLLDFTVNGTIFIPWQHVIRVQHELDS